MRKVFSQALMKRKIRINRQITKKPKPTGIFLEMQPAQLLNYIGTYFGELRLAEERMLLKKTQPKEWGTLKQLRRAKTEINGRLNTALKAWQKDKQDIMKQFGIGTNEKKPIISEATKQAEEIRKIESPKEKMQQIGLLIREMNRYLRESVPIIDKEPTKARKNFVRYLECEATLNLLEKEYSLKNAINYLTIKYT